MSYDLFFRTRDSAAAPAISALAEYFRSRKNYEVSEQQAIYTNESTGIYFIFDLDAESADEDPHNVPLSLNLNYFRPHTFGLEAEIEIGSLVRNFDLLVSDPQNDGMGDGEFSADGFLRGWNTGNEFGYRSILSQQPGHPVLAAPAAKIEAAWQWNLAKDALQQQLGENVFVPQITFISQDGAVETAAVWGDAIPIALPEVDRILIPREQLAPLKFLIRRKDIVSAGWSDLGLILAEFETVDGPVPYKLLNYQKTPAAVANFIKSFAPMAGKPEIVPAESVLDQELVERARS
jgi:hypothetical protein